MISLVARITCMLDNAVFSDASKTELPLSVIGNHFLYLF